MVSNKRDRRIGGLREGVDSDRYVKYRVFCDSYRYRNYRNCDCNKNETPLLEVSSRMDWLYRNYWRDSFSNTANDLAILLKRVLAGSHRYSFISSYKRSKSSHNSCGMYAYT